MTKATQGDACAATCSYVAAAMKSSCTSQSLRRFCRNPLSATGPYPKTLGQQRTALHRPGQSLLPGPLFHAPFDAAGRRAGCITIVVRRSERPPRCVDRMGHGPTNSGSRSGHATVDRAMDANGNARAVLGTTQRTAVNSTASSNSTCRGARSCVRGVA